MENLLADLKTAFEEINIEELMGFVPARKEMATNANPTSAPVYLEKMIEACSLANRLYSSSIGIETKLGNLIKKIEAIASVDWAEDYLKERGIKVSESAKTKVLPMYPQLTEAYDLKGEVLAMSKFLQGEYASFKMAHDDAKKITYSKDDGLM
jgi:hypothetical protein